MSVSRLYLALALAGCLVSFEPAQAQTKENRRPAIAQLFLDTAGKVNESTVRIRANGMHVALGTVVDPAGYILTKGDELFARNKLRNPVTVQLRDGTIYAADVIGYDRNTDLMMLKVDADLPAVSFADNKKVIVGNWVAAPGMESEPVAAGVISTGIRKLYNEEARITRGNRGYLGIRIMKPRDQDGVLITLIEPTSSAAQAKLKVDDIITRIADKSVNSPEELQEVMENYQIGDTVMFTILRGKDELDIKVRLGDKATFDRGEFQNKMGSELSNRRTGFPKVLQHDMVLKPSECGGPLIDLEGNVLGINIARAGRVESWTLPGEIIRPLIKQFKDKRFEIVEETKSK